MAEALATIGGGEQGDERVMRKLEVCPRGVAFDDLKIGFVVLYHRVHPLAAGRVALHGLTQFDEVVSRRYRDDEKPMPVEHTPALR